MPQCFDVAEIFAIDSAALLLAFKTLEEICQEAALITLSLIRLLSAGF